MKRETIAHGPNRPQIELRKFQFAEFASEETNCFSADVWINGKPAFHASNDGHGGCDHYTPLATKGGNYDHESFEAGMSCLNAYCATLPPLMSHGMALTVTVKLLIGEVVEETLRKRDVAKIWKKTATRILWITDKGEIMQTKPLPAAQMDRGLAHFRAKYPAATFLNGLPREEAEKLIAGVI